MNLSFYVSQNTQKTALTDVVKTQYASFITGLLQVFWDFEKIVLCEIRTSQFPLVRFLVHIIEKPY